MTERVARRRAAGARATSEALLERDYEVERTLGRWVAIGLPAVAVVAAVATGVVAGAASALLILASGALLGAIALLWASVRTLSGDAPLTAQFESLTAQRHGVDALAEEKGRLLRTLKDLETEHDLGKIDNADYAALDGRYRDEAKAVMRQMDVEVAPLREEAERLVAEDWRRRGLIRATATATAAPAATAPVRVACRACKGTNDPDAAFCKHCGARIQEPVDAKG